MRRFSGLCVVGAAAVMILGSSAVFAAHHEGGAALPGSAAEVQPILVGTQAPDGPVVTSSGEATTLAKVLKGKPGVVVFYRGHW